jgi:hypothetical protein
MRTARFKARIFIAHHQQAMIKGWLLNAKLLKQP